MGGGPSGGSSNNVPKPVSRERAKMSKTGVQDPEDVTRLAENLQAQKLEREAETKNFLGQSKDRNAINIGSMRAQPSDALPGSLLFTQVRKVAMQQQAKELRRGGEMITDDKGDYQGVVGKGFFGGRVYSGNPDFSPIGGKGKDTGDSRASTKRSDVTAEVTPEITPEVIENDEPITTRYATRRTKRSGQGGTIMEGYGVLSRPASKRSIT